MSVNAVTGSSLQRDLVSALRQARAANATRLDIGTTAAASQATGTAAEAGSPAQAAGTASTPAMSNDLMASLLQLQSDFSQMGLQNGVTAPAEATANADDTSTTGTAPDQAAAGAAPVHPHRGHHGHRPVSDETQNGESEQTGSATDASTSASTPASTPASATPTGEAAASTGSGSDLQSFLQQVTKAITAYATGGPLGIAAALTSSTKA